MDYLYGRLCRLEILDPNTFPTIAFQGVSAATSFDTYRIQFSITKSIDPEENSAEIVITNRQIDSLISNKSVVKLYAGYALSGGEKLLFRGDVINVEHIIEGPDVHTVLTCKEGVVALREDVSLSYGEGTDIKKVLIDLAKKVQEAHKLSKSLDPDMETFHFLSINTANVIANSGYSYIGEPKPALDELCQALGLQWSMQNGKLQFIPRNGYTKVETFVLSPDSGLVGSVTPIESNKKGEERVVKGYKAQSLLFPEILPGDPVKFESKYKTGVFRVQEIEHVGDTHGDRWNSTIKAVEV
jgi:hypothetical protein